MRTPGPQLVDRNFHATYGGSGIHRLLAGCYGQVRMARRVEPAPETEWQRAGTAAHAELEAYLKGTITWDPLHDHAASTQYVLAHVRALTEGREHLLMAEKRVVFPQDIVPAIEASGTLDCCVILRDDGESYEMHIIDYKHGAGEHVDAEENAQLQFYAVAALHTFFNLTQQVERVVMTIIQPNSPFGDPVRSYETTPEKLEAFADRVREAILRAEQLHAPLLPGDHCRFCPAAAICDARERRALEIMTGAEATQLREWAPAELTPPDKLDLARLSFILLHADEIKAWLRDVETYAERRALANEIDVPGMKIVEANARRRWDARIGVVYTGLAEVLGLDPTDSATLDALMPRALIGLTEADKRLKLRAGTDKAERERLTAAVSLLAQKDSSGALSLVPLSDKRPPVNRAAKLMGGVVIEAPPMEGTP